MSPSFLPSRGSRGCLAGGRGDRRGSCSSRALAALNTSSTSSPTFPSASSSGSRESTEMITQKLQGGFGSREGNHFSRNFYLHLLLVIIFSLRSQWGSFI